MGKLIGGDSGELEYIDRPDVSETFVDTLQSVMYDGSSLRMEFAVHRIAPPNANGRASNKKVTAVRLVMPLAGAIGLTSQLSGLMEALEQQGAIAELRFVPTTEGLN
jgi:hypothetical protein